MATCNRLHITIVRETAACAEFGLKPVAPCRGPDTELHRLPNQEGTMTSQDLKHATLVFERTCATPIRAGVRGVG
jgi:hypothetical protein